MAVKPIVGSKLNNSFGLASLANWQAMATGDTGAPVENQTFSDRSIQFVGTFGGATVVLEGSNDGTNWVTLTDPASVALSFTSAGLKQILQVTRYMRPNVSGGAGVSINGYLLIVGK